MNVYIGKDYSAMQGPCDSGYHVPSKDDFDGLASIMSSLGLGSKDSWVQNLHIPLMGELSYNGGTALQRGTHGYYWLCSTNNSYVRDFMMSGNDVRVSSNNSTYGCPIRPFKNLFEVPTSGWTVITGALGGAGIFWDTTNGLISITGDGNTGYTIADKNLGATAVYNNGDTLSESNCGKYYQRGNNYGFAFTGPTATSSTQVNASTYGPGNYYSNSTFITTSSIRWDSSNNDNLRGGVTGVKPGEVQNIYIGEYGWKPGSNTIAYYPLKTDFNDAKTSGTKYNLTNSGATLSELGGVTCANFNGSNSKATGAFYSYGTGDLTASVRGYPLSNNQGVWWCIGLTTLVMNSKNGVVEGTSAPTPLNTWTNIVFTITGGKLKIYSNGTLYLDTSFSNNVTGDLMLGIDGSYRFWFYGGVSELIFENRAWTQSEIQDYYNKTKSNYGL